MQIEIEGILYTSIYYPFFKLKDKKGYSVYGMRLPSGNIEEVFVLDDSNVLDTLKEYTYFLLKEYMLEEDIMLSQKALLLKCDLKELFYAN